MTRLSQLRKATGNSYLGVVEIHGDSLLSAMDFLKQHEASGRAGSVGLIAGKHAEYVEDLFRGVTPEPDSPLTHSKPPFWRVYSPEPQHVTLAAIGQTLDRQDHTILDLRIEAGEISASG
ncbi:MAG: hypothetical protein WAM82_11760 [Thermoanaerobaculia bacterium]